MITGRLFAIVGNKDKEHPLGPAGFSFVGEEGNTVSYTAQKRMRLGSFPTAKLFYGNADSATVTVNENEIPLTNGKAIHQKVWEKIFHRSNFLSMAKQICMVLPWKVKQESALIIFRCAAIRE